MTDNQIQELWNKSNEELERARVLNLQSWVLQVHCFETLQREKARSRLSRVARIKKLLIVAGIAYGVFLLYLVFRKITWEGILFNISLGIIGLVNLYAVGIYIYHLTLIRKIEYSTTILAAQEQLARLQASTLRIARILFLQSPFYCLFWITPTYIRENTMGFLFINIPVFLLLSFAAVWLYRNIHYRNASRKWFRILFNSAEWNLMLEAQRFLDEIEAFRADQTV